MTDTLLLIVSVLSLGGLLALLLKHVWKGKAGRVHAGLYMLMLLLLGSLIFLPEQKHQPNEPWEILTPGSADSLRSHPQALSLAPDAEGYRQWAALLRDSLQQFRLHDYGLPADWLAKAGPRQLEFLPAEVPAGLLDFRAPRQIDLGDTLFAQLRLKASQHKALSLSFYLADSLLDSLHIQSDTSLIFRHVPKQAGLHSYRFLVEADTVSWMLEVREPEPLRLALFTSYPRAEQKFLTDWLKSKGHQLYQESSLRPGLAFRRKVGEDSPDELREALEQADILLFDRARYEGLNRRDLRRLERAVRSGRSVLFWAEEGELLARDGGRVQKLGEQLSPQGYPTIRLQGQQLFPRQDSETMLSWQGGDNLLIRQAEGWGQWAWLGTEASYVWQLQGDTQAYDHFWTSLLRSLSPSQDEVTLQIAGWPQRIHQQVVLQLRQSSLPSVGLLIAPSGDSLQLAFRQDGPGRASWGANFWPRETGWHRWLQAGQERLFYVASEGAYASQLAHSFQQAMPQQQVSEEENEMRLAGLSAWPWLKPALVIFFVLCAASLWAYEKFRQ